MIKEKVQKLEKLFTTKNILFLFLVLYQVFLVYNFVHGHVYLQDSAEYVQSARSFETEGNFYSGSPENERDYRMYSKRTPLYPLILYFISRSGISDSYIYVIQAFLGLFNIYLFYRFLAVFGVRKTVGHLILAIFILFTPAQFIYSQFIMADLWLQTWVMLLLFSALKFYKKPDLKWTICLLLLISTAPFLKPVFLPAGIALGFLIPIYLIYKKKIKLYILLSVLPFLFFYAWSAQNWNRTGVFHFSSIGYINLLHYNTNLLIHKNPKQIKNAQRLNELMIVPHSKAEFSQNYAEVNRFCKEVLFENAGSYALFHSKGILFFFLDPGRFDLFNFFRVENNNSQGFLHKGKNANKLKEIYSVQPLLFWLLLLVFIVKIVKSVGFIGYILKNYRNPAVIAGVFLVFYIAILTGPLGASRFYLPVEGIVMVYATLFYSRFVKPREKEVLE